MKTILIVDDHVQNLQQLVGWLYAESFDIQLLTAKTYEAGSEIMKIHHIDLVILDIDLTDNDDELGLRLAKKYREDYPFNTIIFQTQRNDYNYRIALQSQVGMHLYLDKRELTREKFVSVIKQELERFNVQFTNKIFINQRDKKISVNADTILYLEKVSETKDLNMFFYDRDTKTVKNKLLPNISLDKLRSLPGTGNLFRCHKSYIVNKQMVLKSVMNEDVGNAFEIRHTNNLVPIGRHFRKTATQALQGTNS